MARISNSLTAVVADLLYGWNGSVHKVGSYCVPFDIKLTTGMLRPRRSLFISKVSWNEKRQYKVPLVLFVELNMGVSVLESCGSS